MVSPHAKPRNLEFCWAPTLSTRGSRTSTWFTTSLFKSLLTAFISCSREDTLSWSSYWNHTCEFSQIKSQIICPRKWQADTVFFWLWAQIFTDYQRSQYMILKGYWSAGIVVAQLLQKSHPTPQLLCLNKAFLLLKIWCIVLCCRYCGHSDTAYIYFNFWSSSQITKTERKNLPGENIPSPSLFDHPIISLIFRSVICSMRTKTGAIS